ncbi:MAG: PadR family transcriptional regulator [Streptosporangiaceae bacterium]
MSPVFRHGGLRLYLLKLLDEAPRHGYDVIRLLQDRFLGVYSPSPGTIYPRLARLEAEGLVTHETVNGRKIYRITESGRAELHRRVDDLAALEDELSASVRDIARELSQDVRETVRNLRDELTSAVREASRPRPPQPGSGKPGSGKPGSGKPDSDQRPAGPSGPAERGPAGSGPGQRETGHPGPDGPEPDRPGPGQRETAHPGPGSSEPEPESSRRADGPDWQRWAEEAQRQWRDLAEPTSWPYRDFSAWRGRASELGWPWRTGPAQREPGGPARDTHASSADDTAPAYDTAARDPATSRSGAADATPPGGTSPIDGDRPAGDRAGPASPGRPDLADELLRLAAGFLRDAHRAVWQHAGTLGEESIGKLGDILTEAIERIGREVFAAPGSEPDGPWSASAGTEQPAPGSGPAAANSPGDLGYPGSASEPSTDESR